MKKKLLLSLMTILFLFILACSDETKIYEPVVTENSIDFEFESKENGKLVMIYRNNTSQNISMSFIMASVNKIIDDSQNYDFCPDIINFRKGIVNPDWFVINFNHVIVSENTVANQNDHPNLISYSLPIGTYLAVTMNPEDCNKDQYDVFDITTNDGVQPVDGG